MNKELLIIAGPNGSGKSTLANILLARKKLLPFVNADIIARGLGGQSEKTDIAAGRSMLRILHSTVDAGESIAFETTLSGRSWIRLINNAKERGYQTSICFVAVHPVEVAVSRVKKRVSEGGHHIPEVVIRRRYPRSLNMYFNVYQRLVSQSYFFDNTEVDGKLIAHSTDNKETVFNPSVYGIYQAEISRD
jgi:predicted ABC-type ATPase